MCLRHYTINNKDIFFCLVELRSTHAVGHVIKFNNARRELYKFDHVPTACSYPNGTQTEDYFVYV